MKPHTWIISAMVTDRGLDANSQAAGFQAQFDNASLTGVRCVMSALPCGALFATFHTPSNYGAH